jgi:hypothetical protein
MTGALSGLLKATQGVSRIRMDQVLIDEIENDPVLSGQCEYDGDVMYFRGAPVEVMEAKAPSYQGGKTVRFIVHPGHVGAWKIDNGVKR